MSYRYRITETTELNFKRIASDQLDRALLDLIPENIRQNDGVHQARKRFKKIRSLLRLCRPALADSYTSLNDSFRQAGRKLSAMRDREAMIETCDDLHDHFGSQVKTKVFSPIRDVFSEQLEKLRSNDGEIMQAAAEVSEKLHTTRDHIRSIECSAEGFAVIGGGLAREYKRGKKAFEDAYENPSAEHFHSWRKRAKDYWYHMRLLRDMWPRVINGYRKACDDLSSLLGDDHDLAVLHEHITQNPSLMPNSTDRGVFDDLIRLRQSELRAQARPLGVRLYAEKPRELCARFEQYWLAWNS